jgi:hypothetical protein
MASIFRVEEWMKKESSVKEEGRGTWLKCRIMQVLLSSGVPGLDSEVPRSIPDATRFSD